MATDMNPAGIGVPKRYGARQNYEGSEGRAYGTAGTRRQGVLEFNGDQLDLRTLTIPAGAVVTKTIAIVAEAGDTTDDLNVGVKDSEGTNTAITLSNSDATTRGAYVEASPAGTLASPLTEDVEIAVVSTGTISGGKYRVFIEYEFGGDLDGL